MEEIVLLANDLIQFGERSFPCLLKDESFAPDSTRLLGIGVAYGVFLDGEGRALIRGLRRGTPKSQGIGTAGGNCIS